jgi:hypothetical protein
MSSSAVPTLADTPAPKGVSRVDRFASVGVEDTLERIRDSDLLAAGAVNTIGLEAVRRMLGDRWPDRRTRIWEHVERELERCLSPADLSLRVDEVTYLIAKPGLSAAAARSACQSLLLEILKFFLGEVRPGDLALRTVMAMGDREIVTAPIDPADLARPPSATPGEHRERPAPVEAAPVEADVAHADEWKPPLAGRSTTIEMQAQGCDAFDLRLSIEPVWNLKRDVISSFVMARSGVPSRAEAAELEEVDVAAFALMATLIEEQATHGGPLALHVPVSFTTLATQRARQRLLSITQSIREPMRNAVVLEIEGLNGGVPPSRLVEVVGLIRSLCVGVTGRVAPNRAALQAVKGCGLRGVTTWAPLLAVHQPEAGARLRAFVAAARDVSPNLTLHGLPNAGMLDLAAGAGFSYASVAPV